MAKGIISPHVRDVISCWPASTSLGGPGGEEEKISPLVLDLEKNKAKINHDDRTINLKNKVPGSLTEKIVVEFKKRGRPKKQIFEFLVQEQPPKPIELYFNRCNNLEPLEISHPSREQILATFEEIEILNNYLREYSLEATVSEPLREADILDSLLNIWQVDDFLAVNQEAEKEVEPIKEEEDFLAALIAEPDLAGQILIFDIQAEPSSSLENKKLENLEQFYKPRLALKVVSLRERWNSIRSFFSQPK